MKKLLAIAVAAALTAPAAMADTTLYGKLHASVGSVKTTATTAGAAPTTTSATQSRVESHASRIGVKGATALDNGMEAIYGLEWGVEMDGDNGAGTAAVNAGGSLSARNQFVGLKGKFGTVLAGRHDTPAKLATASQDVFADTYADMGNIINADNLRVNNAVAYVNKFGPVGFAVATSTGFGTGAAGATGVDIINKTGVATTGIDGDSNATSGMVNYSNGPWYAGLGYTSGHTNLAAGAVATVKQTNLGLGWKAEAGHAVNLVMENDKLTAGDAGISAKGKATLINGVYKIGNIDLKAQYGERKESGWTVANAADPSLNGKEKMASVGIDYNLGKKTSVYLLHSKNTNTAAATTGLATTLTNATTTTKATAVGLVTEF